MSHAKKQLIGLATIVGLLCVEAVLASLPVRAITWKRSYACENFAVTLVEQGTGLYTYEAVNAKGQKLTIKNGTHHRNEKRVSVYMFHKDDTEYTLKDFGRSKATLETHRHGDAKATFVCTGK